jgi:hypothetical protein
MTNPPLGGDQPYRPTPFPTHGAPPDAGPPYAPPARKSHVGPIAAVTALLVLLIAGGTALALALEPTVLDTAAVERDVAIQFGDRAGVAVQLTCPRDMEVQAGATHECRGITADDEDVTLRITITDDKSAAYTWTEP